MEINYKHIGGAHCESTMTAGLISHHGGDVTEPFIFGVGSGLSFVHAPFIKMFGLPLTSYRSAAGSILKSSAERLGVKLRIRRFKDPNEAMAALDRELDNGKPVGVQTGMHWLPYLPSNFRLHLNLHNIVVTGKRGSDYLVADRAIMKGLMPCPAAALKKARFSQGEMAPRGKMVTVEHVPQRPSREFAAAKGILGVCSAMRQPIFPIIGVKGIRFLAGRMESWPAKLGAVETRRQLGQVVLMLEEVGTGGAGFRFMFAAFLQEAATLLKEDALLALSARMTTVGDHWRSFAVQGARYCKERSMDGEGLASMAAILRECADQEEAIFRELRDATPKIRAREVA